MYDWERIKKDKIPCYFWGKEETMEDKEIGRCIRSLESYCFQDNRGWDWPNCEPIRTEDKEEYKIKEKEKKWRPCNNWEEFKPFMGKIARSKYNIDRFILINFYDADNNNANSSWWFNNHTLEDGSIIGIEEEA